MMLFPPSLRPAAVTSCVCAVIELLIVSLCVTHIYVYTPTSISHPLSLSPPFIKLTQPVCVMPVMEGFCHFNEIVHSSEKLS